MTDSYSFHVGTSCTVFDLPFLTEYFFSGRFLSKVFFRHFCVCDLGAREDDCVFLSTLTVVVAKAARITF